jgi:hypothetical protein
MVREKWQRTTNKRILFFFAVNKIFLHLFFQIILSVVISTFSHQRTTFNAYSDLINRQRISDNGVTHPPLSASDISIASDSHQLQSGISILASGFSPVGLVTD